MVSKKKSSIIFVLLILFTMILTSNVAISPWLKHNNSNGVESEHFPPKRSGTFNDIVIDDLPGSPNNWEWAKAQGICTGNGTQEQPYLIQGHIFTSSVQDNLLINNSNAHVRIQNCTFDTLIYQAAGLYLENVSNCIVFNNSYTNSALDTHSIKAINSKNINISNNNLLSTNSLPKVGILSLWSNNTTIFKNNLSNFTSGTIISSESNNTIIAENIVCNSTAFAIGISHSNNQTVVDNNLTNNVWGIMIYGEYVKVYRNIVVDSESTGIFVHGIGHKVSENSIINNTGVGIRVYGNYTNISRNIVSNGNYGINLTHGEHNIVFNNNISRHIHGINLYRNNHSNLVGNFLYETNYSINLEESNNNSISENKINQDFITLIIEWEESSIKRTQNGISIENSTDNRINGNNISHTDYGAVIKQGNRNNLSENIFNSNSFGLMLSNSNSSHISNNIVLDNLLIGVNVSNGHNNIFYNNLFVNNTLHALDDSINNFWNNTFKGNYWDDYLGTNRGDGIGNTSYVLGNIIDQLPLCKFYFGTLLDNQIIGTIGPQIDLIIVDPTINSITYMLINTTNNAHLTTNYTWIGYIDQAVWDQMGNGTIEIRFFINNTLGQFSVSQIVLRKDIFSPSITVENLLAGVVFNSVAPNTNNFTVVISDPSGIDLMQYMLINRTNIAHHTTERTWNGYIEQSVWDQMANGSIIVRFIVNDTVGNERVFEFILEKNIIGASNPQKKDDSLLILTIVLTTAGIVGGAGAASGYLIYSTKKATKFARKLAQRKLKKLRKKSSSKDKYNKFKKPTKSSKEILHALSNKEKLLELFDEDISIKSISHPSDHPLTIVSKDFLTASDKIGFTGGVKEDFVREMLSFSPKERVQVVNDILSENDVSAVTTWKKREKAEDVLIYEGFALELIQEYVEKHKRFDPASIVPYLSSRFSRASININENGIKKIMRSLIEQNIVVEGSILTRKNIFNNNNRYRIYSNIQKNPGTHLSKLVKKVNMSSAVVRWHLSVLGRFQFVRAEKIGNRVAYYDQKGEHRDTEMLHFISREKCKRIIQYLLVNTEGCQLTNISQELSIHYNTTKKYLGKLEKYGLISTFKKKFFLLNEKKFEEINTSLKDFFHIENEERLD